MISSGMALGILADVAEHRASRVLQLLPECLDAYKSWTHALLSEMLAYAWWKCAEFVPAAYAHKARAHLNSLFEPDLTNVSTEYHLFALRGAAIAQLGAICLDLHLPSSALSGRQTAYPLGTLQFFYLNLSDFITAHADTIKTHPHYL
jgi:hypothetical protein